ncbi:ATP-binding protein [Candidatus Pelagibacter sp.]|nr:ATP-binding protein [Candidatus Pelagibacter sp.]
MSNTINIRPGVGYLSILSAINYTPWHATAEFVDNSIQSYLDNKVKLRRLHNNYKLKIDILISSSAIEVKDNAGGINAESYERAFQAATRPKKQSGLSEFGMGMKTAACWFSNIWSVTSTAIGEDFATEARFDVQKLTEEEKEKIIYKKSKINKNAHYTIVLLKDLNQRPRGSSVARIKDHLASMYRSFIEKNEIEIRYNGALLKYKEPKVLKVADYRDVREGVQNPKKKLWKKNFDFKFLIGNKRKEHSVRGSVGLLETMSTHKAGLAVFRRNRLIFGSDDQPWRPTKIVIADGSPIGKRLFGELHFDDDMEVTHTKDNLSWSDDDQSIFLNKLKSVLNSDELPLLTQAMKYTKKDSSPEFTKIEEKATQAAVESLKKAVQSIENVKFPKIVEIPRELPKTKTKPVVKMKKISFEDQTWTVFIKLNKDKDTHNKDWLQISLDPKTRKKKVIEIQIMANKGYTAQYFGDQQHELEGLQLLASYIALAEIISKERGEKNTHLIRYYINKIIDTVPPTID